MPTPERIFAAMQGHSPKTLDKGDRERAAVALVLRPGDRGVELLFIERATREGDPWSGHMAFPGGRLGPEDESERAAAERETLEEVGVSLECARYLGPLAEIQGNPRHRPSDLVVSAHVYFVESHGPMVLEESEVRDAIWFPLSELIEAGRQVEHVTPRLRDYTFPGIEVGIPGRHVVWGLTYRFLDIFMSVIDHPLPDRWGGIRALDESID